MPEQNPMKKRFVFLACKLCVSFGLARYGNGQIPGNLEIRFGSVEKLPCYQCIIVKYENKDFNSGIMTAAE